MKLLLLLPLLCGCVSPNLAKVVRELKNDNATVNFTVTSPMYGTLSFTRTNPGTNTAAHTIQPNGTVSVSK